MNRKTFTAVLVGTIALGAVVISLSWGQPRNSMPQGGNENGAMSGIGSAGPERAYLENGVLYQSRPGDPNEKTNRKKVAEGIYGMLDQKGAKVLFSKENGKPKLPSEGPVSPDLWIADTASGTVKKIYDRVSIADMSPTDDMIAVSTMGDELHLITPEGKFIKKIGIHGTEPLFSPDGKLLAYVKLNDGAVEMGQDMVQGIAVYDVVTKKDTLITRDNNDFALAGFSADMSKLYFNSGRAYLDDPGNHIVSLWMVDIDGSNPTRLTNEAHSPSSPGRWPTPYFGRSIWSSDKLTAISDSQDRGVWMYSFSQSGGLKDVKFLSDGNSPQWVAQDSVIAVRNGGDWDLVPVRK